MTKETLLDLLPDETFVKFIDKIDFAKLDKFVQLLVAGFVSRKGQNTVKKEIDADSTSETSNFLTHIIEVGSLKILAENNLINSDGNNNEQALVVVALAMNISMATALKSKNVYNWDTPVYYDMSSLMTIFNRIATHIDNAIQDTTYTNSLVNNYLINKI
jgi:hypothetical protein